MKAIGYVRVSTDKQDNSAEAQKKRIEAQALLKDIDLEDVIIDIDEFSGNLNRPGIQRVLDLVKAKKVDAVIITKLDRLTRSTRDAIDLIELFGKKGVALISITESLDTESPMGRFFVRMIASIAELEREMIGARTRDGMRHIKSQGFPAGPAPYGWTAQQRTAEERAAKIRKPLLINPDEQGVLAIARGARESGCSYERIADLLNSRGFLTRSGGAWVKQYVVGILKTTQTAVAA